MSSLKGAGEPRAWLGELELWPCMNTYGVSSRWEGAPQMVPTPGFVAGSAYSGGRPAWTGWSLTPRSGVCELPTKAGAEHFIRVHPSWRQGLHDAPPAEEP